MNNGSAVAKTVWTEADFDAMDWHDNAIHAIAVEPVPDNPGRLLVDLDYIQLHLNEITRSEPDERGNYEWTRGAGRIQLRP